MYTGNIKQNLKQNGQTIAQMAMIILCRVAGKGCQGKEEFEITKLKDG